MLQPKFCQSAPLRLKDFVLLAVTLAAVGSGATACVKKKSTAAPLGNAQREDDRVPLNVDEATLFLNNQGIPHYIGQQLRIQLFNAVKFVNRALKPTQGPSAPAEIKLIEIAITKGDRTAVNVSVDANAGMNMRKLTLLDNSGKSDKEAIEKNQSLGVTAGTKYDLITQTYKVTYRFLDSYAGPKSAPNTGQGAQAEVDGTAQANSPDTSTLGRTERTGVAEVSAQGGEVHQFDLKKMLEVEELLHVESNASINFDAIAALPDGLKQVVAVFVEKINLEIKGQTSFTRDSELATAMFYRGKDDQGITKLENRLLQEVAIPLCQTVLVTRGWQNDPQKRDLCAVQVPSIPDPLAEAQRGRVARSPIFPLRSCLRDRSGSLFGPPLYFIYFSVFRDIQRLTEDSKINFWEKTPAAWHKTREWATVMATVDDSSKCPGKSEDEMCMVARYGSYNFGSRCQKIAAEGGDNILGVTDINTKDVIPR